MEEVAATPEAWSTAAKALRGNSLRELKVHDSFALSRTEEESAALRELCEALGSNTSLISLEMWSRCTPFERACTVALGEALQRNTVLQQLSLNSIGLMGATRLVEGVRGNSSLRQLTVTVRDLGREDMAALGRALWTKASLQMLHHVLGDHIGSDATTKLAEALQSKAALEVLYLPRNSIDSEGASTLAWALRHNTSLRELSLLGNELHDAGAIALGRALEINSSLKTLDLRCNGIGSEGAAALAQALQVNASLQTLELGSNSSGSAGAAALSQALLVSVSLQTLDLRRNDIGSEGACALAQALQVNASLECLDLRHNCIGSSGAVALVESLQSNRSLRVLAMSEDDMVGLEGEAATEQADVWVNLEPFE